MQAAIPVVDGQYILGLKREVVSKLEHKREGFNIVVPGVRGALPTEEIRRRMNEKFPNLEVPFLELDHQHGVLSKVHVFCKDHGVISRINLDSAMYGQTKYGCDVCAMVGRETARKGRHLYSDQNMSRKWLQTGIFLAVKKEFPDAQWEVTMSDGKELDIYIPSIKLGIEHNGLYWHSHALKKDANYHRSKTFSAALHDIAVIHVWEDLAIPPFTNIVNMCKLARGDFHLRAAKNEEMRDLSERDALEFHSLWNCKPLSSVKKCQYHVGLHRRGTPRLVVSYSISDRGEVVVMGLSYKNTGYNLIGIFDSIKAYHRARKLIVLADALTPVESSICKANGLVPVKHSEPFAWWLDDQNHIAELSGNPPTSNCVYDCGIVRFEA